MSELSGFGLLACNKRLQTGGVEMWMLTLPGRDGLHWGFFSVHD